MERVHFLRPIHAALRTVTRRVYRFPRIAGEIPPALHPLAGGQHAHCSLSRIRASPGERRLSDKKYGRSGLEGRSGWDDRGKEDGESERDGEDKRGDCWEEGGWKD